MQTSAFGKSKGLWLTLTEGSWSEAFDGLGISLLLTSNPAIQVLHHALNFVSVGIVLVSLFLLAVSLETKATKSLENFCFLTTKTVSKTVNFGVFCEVVCFQKISKKCFQKQFRKQVFRDVQIMEI